MANHYKIHELLNASELEELEAFAREPGRTIDEIAEWLEARGFVVARSSVGRWKQDFDQKVMAERFSRSSELAQAMNTAIARDGIEAVAEGAMKQLTQVVFEQSAMLEAGGKVDPLDVMRWTRSLNTLIGSKRAVVKLEAELAEAKKRQTAAIAAAEDAKKTGGDPVAAIKKVLLGI